MSNLNARMTGTQGPSDPAVGVIVITLADVEFPESCRGFHCNVAGSLSVTMQDDTTATFVCSAGVTYPYAIRGTLAAGSATFEGYALK